MIGIVGGGIAGLAAVYRLQNRGHDVWVFEATDSLGGLATTYETNGDDIEKFHHHLPKPEETTVELAAELGLEDGLEWRIGKDTYYADGAVHPLDTAWQTTTYPYMSLYDKSHLGVLILGVDVRGGIPDFDVYEELAEYEHIPVGEFVIEHTTCGVYDNFVDPLLDGKSGERRRDVPVSWFLGRVRFRGERDLLRDEKLGHSDGGFAPFIDALVEVVGHEHTETDTRVTELDTDGEAAPMLTVETDDGAEAHEVELVVVATMSDVLEDLTSFPYDIDLQGTVCGLTTMSESLMDTHWLNIAHDAPLGSLIEHTNFASKERYGGDHLLYVVSYVQEPHEELWQMSDKEVENARFGEIEEMFPDFDRSVVEEFRIIRNPRAGPVYECGYLDLVVPYDLDDDVAEGVYYVGVAPEAQYPERSLNGGIVAGHEVADRIDRSQWPSQRRFRSRLSVVRRRDVWRPLVPLSRTLTGSRFPVRNYFLSCWLTSQLVSVDETSDQSAFDGAHEELMAATYRALCAHGYADLTMQRIVDEAGKSKSLLHYHYGTKQELFVAFPDYLFNRFEARVAAMEGDAPKTRLRALLDKMVPNNDDDGDYDRFGLTLNELRTQAPYVEIYRERIARNKAVICRHLADTIREGVEKGGSREVDADQTASLLFAALDGARL